MKNIYHDVLVINEQKNCSLAKMKTDDSKYIIIVNEKLNDDDPKIFKNLELFPGFDENNSEVTLIDLNENFNKETIREFYKLLNKMLEIHQLIMALKEISYTFKTGSKTKYLKFRGDFAEAIYLYKNKNAKKLYETESADISDGNELIEIKSFDELKRRVTISLKQIHENTRKIAIPLIMDQNGKTILELADKITDPKFKEYLKETYEDASEINTIKYKIDNIEMYNFEKDIEALQLPENIVSASFTIEIKR